VKGATTGESSTSNIRRPAKFLLTATSTSASGIEDQEAFAVGMRLHLTDEIEVDDRRAMDPLEAARIQTFLQILHRFAKDQRVVAGLDAHIIARRVDPFDRVDVYPEDLALVFDIDHFFEAVRGRALGRRFGEFLGCFGRVLGKSVLQAFRLFSAALL